MSIDISLAMEQVAGNEALAKELLGMLLNELPELNGKLAKAITDCNAKAMWDHAHKIYGATAYCGVPGLRTTAQAMEAAIKGLDQNHIQQCYSALNREIDQVVTSGPVWLSKSWS